MAPPSREIFYVGNCIPSRILVRTKTLSRIIRPSFGMIRIIWVGNLSSRNVLIRIMKISPGRIRSELGVVKVSPNRIGSGLGVAQSVRLISSRWEPRVLMWILHAKSIGWNRHRGGRDIRRNLSASWVVPSML
jgi:hypothetical protein